jgi:hypothetical protein
VEDVFEGAEFVEDGEECGVGVGEGGARGHRGSVPGVGGYIG